MKILIADSQSKVRFAVATLLRDRPGWQIAGHAANAREALACSAALQPDVVLLDWDLPGLQQPELIQAVRKLAEKTAIIITSANPEVRALVLREGGDFFVSKIDPPERLIEAFSACERKIKQAG